nr:IS66 family transposase [Azospirillum brasilense]
MASNTEALIASLKLEIEKLRRELYGTRSERKARLLDQLEFQLEELEATASEDELAAEQAAARITAVAAFTRKRPSRQPFPDHLPRERVVVPAPANCPCCGSDKLCKLDETITETLEVIPRRWKVIQTVRERFSCRACETISQPPAPFHTTPRGWAGPNLLATLLFEKFGQHQPLNRQAERYAREGVPLSLSTLADQVGTAAAVLKPLHDLIAAHVMAAGRLHGDDTPVPVLAKGKTDTGRLWVYVRDDRPFAGQAPPAALFHYSRDRKGEHPERHLAGFTGWLQADAFAGYNRLYEPDRRPGPISEVLCWAHARRGFFKLADIAMNTKRGKDAPPISPLALEAVRRIDALFDLERALNGKPAAERLAARQEHGVTLGVAGTSLRRSSSSRSRRLKEASKPLYSGSSLIASSVKPAVRSCSIRSADRSAATDTSRHAFTHRAETAMAGSGPAAGARPSSEAIAAPMGSAASAGPGAAKATADAPARMERRDRFLIVMALSSLSAWRWPGGCAAAPHRG